MKRILALLLSLLTVASMFGCAAAGDKTADHLTTLLPYGDMTELSAESAAHSKVIADDDAYIRGGTYANTVYNADRKNTGILLLKTVKDSPAYTRHVLIHFDLTKLNLTGMNRVRLFVDFEGANFSNLDGNSILVYGVASNWSSATVTYNNAPAYDAASPIGRGIMSTVGICSVDVTDYVMAQKAAGAKAVSFRIVAEETGISESEIFSTTCQYESKKPTLFADYSATTDYNRNILADAAENAKVWDYAQSMYDDWYARYQEILLQGDYDAERIVSNPDDYQTVTPARKGSPTATVNEYKTRLMTTLSGYEPDVRQESIYGGDMTAERQRATGRFYTMKIDGRWWVIDPLGYPCYIRGVNHMNYSYQSGSPYQKEQMLRVYGSEEKWAISATRWAQEKYYMNVAAGWHKTIAEVEDGLSYLVRPLGIGGYANKLGIVYAGTPMTLMYNNSMPVFDPAYVVFVDEQAKTEIESRSDKSHVFGYATDNETLLSTTALSQYLALDYTVEYNVYSYAVAWTFYCNITGETDPLINDIEMYSDRLGVDLQDLFLGFVYDRYHKVMSTVVKTYDPEGLYLGVRSLTASATSEWYLRMTGYWCDIYCVNYYNAWEISEDVFYNIERWLGKPMLVTEFYAKGMDAESPLGGAYPNTDGAGWTVETQTQRGEFYQNFCLRLLESKTCIGWLYFQYIDNDPHVNSQASNKGMVNCDHDTEVYEDMNKQIALINSNVYGLVDFFDGN